MMVPAQSAQTLLEKIHFLPTDRIAEVEGFVDLLQERAVTKEPLDFQVIAVLTEVTLCRYNQGVRTLGSPSAKLESGPLSGYTF